MPIPRWAWGLIGVAVVVLALWLWGNSRYNAGVSDTDAKWVEAGDRLREAAVNSAAAADDNAGEREANFMNEVAQEREQIDAAEQNGSSVFDVLFPGS